MSNSNNLAATEALHSIRIAVQRSGLSGHVIRIWEKRYQAVAPARTGTRHRLYSDRDIVRLRLLREVTQMGHTIGRVAKLSEDQLRQLMTHEPLRVMPTPGVAGTRPDTEWVQMGIEFIKALDSEGLTRLLRESLVALGHQGFLVRLAAPLAHALGTTWQQGEITAAHEHFASSHLKNFLTDRARSIMTHSAAPSVIVATPSGQVHELGAAIAAAAAVNAGWKTIYLGPNLPAAEIAGAAIQNRCAAVALSVVYPDGDPQVASELETLRRCLPESIQIVVGGRAAASYTDVLRSIQAHQVRDLPEFFAWLEGKNR